MAIEWKNTISFIEALSRSKSGDNSLRFQKLAEFVRQIQTLYEFENDTLEVSDYFVVIFRFTGRNGMDVELEIGFQDAQGFTLTQIEFFKPRPIINKDMIKHKWNNHNLDLFIEKVIELRHSL